MRRWMKSISRAPLLSHSKSINYLIGKTSNNLGFLNKYTKFLTPSNLGINCPKTSKKYCFIWSVPVYLTGMRLGTGEFLILVSPKFASDACSDYLLRWNIETLFGCLKSRGFRLEDSHLTDSTKLKKLIAILSIAFSWAFLLGFFLSQQKSIKLKKHSRPEKSIFRLGFDKLRRFFSYSLSSFDSLIYNVLSST